MATPENELKQPMAMTAPVLMNNEQSSDGSTCPKSEYMAFVLPSKYSMESNPPPKPTNPNVNLRTVPAKTCAVHTFSGTANPASAAKKVTHNLSLSALLPPAFRAWVRGTHNLQGCRC